jgi:cytochrome c
MILIKRLTLAACALGFIAVANAGDRGTIDEAKALVKKARAYIHEVGPDKAFAEFNNPKGQFIDRDLYVFVNDTTGQEMANGGNPRLVGKNVLELRDVDGVYVTKGMLEQARKGGGTMHYKFRDPVSGNIVEKIGYAELEGNFVVGSGVHVIH